MISSLSIFFRTSLSKGNDIIPLSEEKRHTLSYLYILAVPLQRYPGIRIIHSTGA
ncbi:MAG: histidine kinase [Blautia sp.]